MAQLNSVQTAVTDLEIGMYVTGLDKPWAETPFIVEGFYVTSQEDINELERHCKFVYIDVYRGRAGSMRRTSRVMGRRADAGANQSSVAAASVDAVQFRPRSTNVAANLFGHLKPKKYEDTVSLQEELPAARAAYAKLLKAVSAMMSRYRADATLDLSAVRDCVVPVVESVVRNPDACVWLTVIKSEESYSYSHGASVAVWAVAFARQLGLPNVVMQRVALGALVFDIGKLRVPEQLLSKRERLSPGEFELLKSHVEFGMEMLNGTGVLNRTVSDMVESHHERHGGHGYPRGLKADEIPVFGRIAAIIDCYDAITSRRPYSTPMSPSHAVKQLYAWRDIDFQGELVEEFIQALGVYPAGTLVELSNSEVGVVYAGYRTRALRPILLMLLDSDKQPLPKTRQLDLSAVRKDAEGRSLDIATSLEPGAFGLKLEDMAL